MWIRSRKRTREDRNPPNLIPQGHSHGDHQAAPRPFLRLTQEKNLILRQTIPVLDKKQITAAVSLKDAGIPN